MKKMPDVLCKICGEIHEIEPVKEWDVESPKSGQRFHVKLWRCTKTGKTFKCFERM